MKVGFLGVGAQKAGTSALDGYLRKRHIDGAHQYLFVLGVDPSYQGRGLGGVLLRRLSARADAASMPIYLETDDPANVPLYQRFGYQILTEERVAALPSVTFWRMQRDAVSAAGP